MSLDQIIANTNISRRFLEAIEKGDFKQLPGGIFSTSYVRQYARAVGFDEEVLLQYFEQCTGERAPAKQARPEAGGGVLRRFLQLG